MGLYGMSKLASLASGVSLVSSFLLREVDALALVPKMETLELAILAVIFFVISINYIIINYLLYFYYEKEIVLGR